jgi:hypothetical protein
MNMSAERSKNDRQPLPSRGAKTDREYDKGGQQLMDRAMRLHPNAIDAVDAFVRLCGDPTWVLRPATTRQYKAWIIKYIETEVTAGRCDPDRAVAGIEEITELLKARRGKPGPRTSRLKCMTVTREEIQLIADDMRRRIIARQADEIDAALLGYVELDPRFGLRPCEWLRSRVEGPKLVVHNAKYADHRAPGPHRCIGFPDQSKGFVRATPLLIEIIAKLTEKRGSWESVHRILAERLARICHRLGLVRISLYSLRHAAIATWKKAKLDRVTLAALAGHISVKTASRYYAPSKHGWDLKNMCVAADPATLSVVRRHVNSSSTFRIPAPWSPPASWVGTSSSMTLPG